MKKYKCKACGNMHVAEAAPTACASCGKAEFDEVAEASAAPQIVQLNVAQMQEMVANTVRAALEPLSRIDRNHLRFPGTPEHEAEGMKDTERVMKFFRSIVAGDVAGAMALSVPAGMQTRTTLDETTGAQGLVLVPEEFMGEVWRLIPLYGIARRDCRVVPMSRKVKSIQTLATGVTAYWVTEGNAITKGEPTFGDIDLTAKKLAALVANTEEFLEDAGIEVLQLVAQLVAEAMAQAEDTALFTGTSPITGIFAKTGVTQVTLAAGKTAFANITYDDILDIVDSLTAAGLRGAKFYFHNNTMTILRKLKDNNGRYILQEPLNGLPGSLAGYPYELSDVMPGTSSSAANTNFIAFGNLRQCAAFGDRKQLAVKQLTEGTVGTENLGEECKTALRFVERADIAIPVPAGLTRLKTAAV
ncbi:phage major capsid protein [bacterium]|nr:phage major capsid protein [bacterium]